MKAWFIQRVRPAPRRASMWRWETALEEGVFATKVEALEQATENMGRFRVVCLKLVKPARGSR